MVVKAFSKLFVCIYLGFIYDIVPQDLGSVKLRKRNSLLLHSAFLVIITKSQIADVGNRIVYI